MRILLETNYLEPNATFWVLLAVMLAAWAVLVAWPLFESLASRQWGYALGVLILGPLGGLVWLMKGRRETRRSPRTQSWVAG